MRASWVVFVSWLILSRLATAGEIPHTLPFPKEVYGAQNQNWMFSLLHDQMLVVANSAGLMLFDGSRWSVYPMPDNQVVRAVATDGAGAIFCGGYGSFGYWQGDDRGSLVYYDLSKTLSASDATNEEIWNIVALPGKVIFQSFSKIYIYDYQRVHTLAPPGTVMFISEVDGRLLVPGVQHGIFELKPDGQFELLPGTESLAGKRVAAILPWAQGGYLIGTQDSGIYRYWEEETKPLDNPILAELRENQLNRAIRLSNGNLVFGTILNGVYITDSAAQKLVFHLNKENGLQNNTVLSVLEDASYNLWVGMDKGISYVKLNDKLVFYDDELVDIGTVYSAIMYRGQLYVGSNQGIYHQTRELIGEGYGQQDQFQLLPGSQGQVWQLMAIDGQLLVGHNSGTFLVEDRQMRSVSSQVGGWYTILVPGNDRRLLQATYTGIAVLDKDANEQWCFSHELEGFSRSLKKILLDEKGYLWGVSPYKGLFRFELNAQFDQIVSIKMFTKQEGLPTEFRPDILLVGNQLVVKAGKDFLIPDGAGRKLIPVDALAGIDLSPGDYKLIYFSDTEYFKAYPDHVEWFFKGKKQRLDISLVPNHEQIISLSEDLILFCLDQGYALLDRTRKELPSRVATRPLISEIRVNGRHSLYPFLQPDQEQAWTFAPSERHLQFLVGYPDLPRSMRLEYRLLGYTEHWSMLNNDSKEFTNLPPGQYQFQLRAYGMQEIRNFVFSILPKWYQTTVAKVIYFLLFGAALWILYRIQERRLALQIRNLHIEKERQLHLQRIQARNEQLQASILGKSKELASTTMNLIQKNEILIKIRNQLNKIKADIPHRNTLTDAQKLIHLIDHHLTNEQDWELFEKNFSEVHESFLKKLKKDFPELTPGDMRLAAYLKMNLSSKEIAPLLNISIRGVENKRYRLRSKLGLDNADNLTEFMMRY